MESQYKTYSLGYVAEDKKSDSVYVKIYPVEFITTANGNVTEGSTISTINKDIDGNNATLQLNKSHVITAKWSPVGDGNRITPPDVCIGELVQIYNFAGSDKYFWTLITTNPDLRKHEKAVYFFSNKSSAGIKDFIKKGYSLIVDTYEKYVRLFTPDNDGELTTYEVSINTKEGIVTIADGLKNSIELTSREGVWEITATNSVRLKTKFFSVSNGSDDLITILKDLIAANKSESHIGNLGVATHLDPNSSNAYDAISERISKFIEK